MTEEGREVSRSLGLLVLRFGMGLYMATHGFGKVQMILDGRYADFGDPIGIGAGPSLVLATTAEFLGSILVVVGLATRPAALLVVITMGVAAFVVHASDGWTMASGVSKEPALLFLTGFLALVLTGPGGISLDALVVRRRRAAI